MITDTQLNHLWQENLEQPSESNWPPERPASHQRYWLRLDYNDPRNEQILEQWNDIPATVSTTLFAEETRPRAALMEKGILLILRGLNETKGEDIPQLASIRLWFDHRRLISVQRFPIAAMASAREVLDDDLPEAGALIAELCSQIVADLSEYVGNVVDDIDELEENLLDKTLIIQRSQVAGLRQKIIALRRYLAPMRDALAHVSSMNNQQILDGAQMHLLREASDQLTRIVEELDLTRERSIVIQEELQSRLSEQLNRRMYLIAVMTVIFMPLTFVTGLLGVNLAGIPGASDEHGFAWLILGLGAAFVALLLVLKRYRWY